MATTTAKPEVNLRTKTRIADLEPAQRIKALLRFRAACRGEVKIPLRCGHCSGTAITKDWPDARKARPDKGEVLEPALTDYYCITCGRRTKRELAHERRTDEIIDYIINGGNR